MPTRRKVTIPLYDGDDLAELQRLRRRAIEAAAFDDNGEPTLADTSAEDARQEYNDFLAAAEERAEKVVLQALPRSQWRELVREHPAREVDDTEQYEDFEDVLGDDGKPTGERRSVTKTRNVKRVHDDDLLMGINYDTMPPLLLAAAVVEPAGFDVEDLSEPDFDRLTVAALTMNREFADPKALPAFAPTPQSDET